MKLREKLLWKFTERASPKDIPRIEEKLDRMNRGPIKEIWDKVKMLWRFIKDPEAPWEAKAVAIGALLYLISPLDAVPDIILGVGLLDDVAVILFVCKKLADALKKYIVEAVREAAEKKAKEEVAKHREIVRISVLGAIAIAVIVLTLKLI